MTLTSFQLAADPELSVKNGAELLDRLLKDIVAESASYYVPHFPETEKHRTTDSDKGIVVPHPDDDSASVMPRRAFSLSRFIPLLSDRIYVVSPFTRSFLVSWISVLDSVPELELITYLPHLLDGLLWGSIFSLTHPFLDLHLVQKIPIRSDRRCSYRSGKSACRVSS